MFIDWDLLGTLACVNAIGALGYYIAFSSGQLSMAQGAMYMVGGYAGGLLATKFALPSVVYMIVAFIAAAIIGYLAGIITSRLRGLYFTIATFALGGVLTESAGHIPIIGGAFGLGGIPNFTTLPLAAIVLIIVALVAWRFDRSLVYVAHGVTRIDQDAALVLGLPIARIRRFAFAVGAGIGGVSGILYAGSTTIITPTDGGFDQSLAFLLMVVIGGANSWRGALLGAAIWTALPELLRATDEWRMVIFGAAAVALMIWRPTGIIPRRIFGRRSRQWLRGFFGMKPLPAGSAASAESAQAEEVGEHGETVVSSAVGGRPQDS